MEKKNKEKGVRWKDKEKNFTPNSRARQAYDFFINKGYNAVQAAGIVGNLSIESGNFSEDVISGKRRGDGGKAVGIAQWHPDRQKIFKQVFNKDIGSSSFDEQLSFIDYEFNNNEKRAFSKLKEVGSAEEAAAVVDKYYERSSGEHRDRRINSANQFFQHFNTNLVQEPQNREVNTSTSTDFSFTAPIVNTKVAESTNTNQEFMKEFNKFLEFQRLEKTRQQDKIRDNKVKSVLQEKINQRKFLEDLISTADVPFIKAERTEI